MLNFLDTMIGFAFIMLIFALAVTAIVEAIGTYVFNNRGAALRQGLTSLLTRIDASLADQGHVIVDTVLRDTLVARKSRDLLDYVNRRPLALATVIQREEFLRLLLDLAAATRDPERRAGLPAVLTDAGDKLYAALAKTGITDPADTLKKIRLRYVAIELAHPEMSNAARATMAIIETIGEEGLGGDFLGRLHSWFDQSIDRVEDIFTTRIRQVTFFLSLILVAWLHFDAVDLVNRLSRDETLRDKLVETAVSDYQRYKPLPAKFGPDAAAAPARPVMAAPAPAEPVAADDPDATGDGAVDDPDAMQPDATTVAAVAADPTPDDTGKQQACAAQAGSINAYLRCTGLGELASYGVIYLPDGRQSWLESWTRDPLTDQPRQWLRHLFGMMLSVALLCLGAPFWYATLSNFIRLRSTLAQKDDAARTERQTTQAS
jgi:hypothetical protein